MAEKKRRLRTGSRRDPTPEEVERWRGVLEDMLEVHWRADDGIVADAFRFALTALDRIASLEAERDEAREYLRATRRRVARVGALPLKTVTDRLESRMAVADIVIDLSEILSQWKPTKEESDDGTHQG